MFLIASIAFVVVLLVWFIFEGILTTLEVGIILIAAGIFFWQTMLLGLPMVLGHLLYMCYKERQ